MADYTRAEARDWAREHMRGVCGCLLPTLSSSLRQVNEGAIRHDVRLQKQHGFWGTLIVSEAGTTDEELRQVIDVTVDEAGAQGLRTVLLASAPTLDDTIEMVRYGESAGVDLVLLGYPLLFYPKTEDEVLEFTRAVADATDLGLMLFAISHWNFTRLHPSSFSPRLIGRMIDEIDNVVAVKNEIGGPGVAGIWEVFHRFNDRVVVCDPFERNAPAWIDAFGMPFMGTSNYEYMGGQVPRYFDLLQSGQVDEGMELYWRLHPARQANAQVSAEWSAGTRNVHRLVWKYQYWLSGYNGGPIRQPQARINDGQMATLRRGLERSGLEIAPGSDEDFFVGRNPMD